MLLALESQQLVVRHGGRRLGSGQLGVHSRWQRRQQRGSSLRFSPCHRCDSSPRCRRRRRERPRRLPVHRFRRGRRRGRLLRAGYRVSQRTGSLWPLQSAAQRVVHFEAQPSPLRLRVPVLQKRGLRGQVGVGQRPARVVVALCVRPRWQAV